MTAITAAHRQAGYHGFNVSLPLRRPDSYGRGDRSAWLLLLQPVSISGVHATK